MALSRAAAKQAMPASFVAMQDVLYPTYESLITSARHLAAGMGVTLTITHKSRNTPSKSSTRRRETCGEGDALIVVVVYSEGTSSVPRLPRPQLLQPPRRVHV